MPLTDKVSIDQLNVPSSQNMTSINDDGVFWERVDDFSDLLFSDVRDFVEGGEFVDEGSRGSTDVDLVVDPEAFYQLKGLPIEKVQNFGLSSLSMVDEVSPHLSDFVGSGGESLGLYGAKHGLISVKLNEDIESISILSQHLFFELGF